MYKWGFVSAKLIVDNRELIDAIGAIITSCIIVLAALVSYFRFFKGRLLKPKMIIEPSYGVVELNDGTLHWIDIGIENKGSVAIWHYTVGLELKCHDDSVPKPAIIDFHSHRQFAPGKEHVIDPGETAYEHATIRVPKNVEVITYRILVTNSQGSKWDRCLTVSNRA